MNQFFHATLSRTILLAIFATPSLAGEVSDSPVDGLSLLSTQQYRKLVTHDVLIAESVRLEEADQGDQAVEAAEHAVNLVRETLGTDDLRTADALDNLANRCTAADRWQMALSAAEESLQIRDRLGQIDPLRALQQIVFLEAHHAATTFTAPQQLQFQNAFLLSERAAKLLADGQTAKAIEADEQAGPIYRELFGQASAIRVCMRLWIAEAYFQEQRVGVVAEICDQIDEVLRPIMERLECKAGSRLLYLVRGQGLALLAQHHADNKQYVRGRKVLLQQADVLEKAYGENIDQAQDVRALADHYSCLAGLAPEQFESLSEIDTVIDETSRFVLQNNFADALEPAQEVVQAYRRLLGEDSYVTADALHLLGQVQYEMNQPAESVSSFQQAMRIRVAALGARHTDTLVTVNFLARALESLIVAGATADQLEMARTIHREMLDLAINTHGKDSWQASSARVNADLTDRIASMTPEQRQQYALARRLTSTVNRLSRQGRQQQAIPLAKQAVELDRKVLGEDHLFYADSLFNLGVQHRWLGQGQMAAPYFQQCLRIREKILGKRSPGYVNALQSLGIARQSLGRMDQAETLLRQAVAISRQVYGENSYRHPDILASLAGVLRGQMRLAEAETLNVESLALDRLLRGTDNIDYVRNLQWLGVVYRMMGRYEEAEARFREAVAIRERINGKNSFDYSDVVNSLGYMLYSAGRYQDALPYLIEARDTCAASAGTEVYAYVIRLLNLIRVYAALGERDKTAELIAELKENRKKVLHQYPLAYASALQQLGSSLFWKGSRHTGLPTRFEAELAEQTLREALEAYGEKTGQDSLDYGATQYYLGIVYRLIGDYEQAETLMLQAAVRFEKHARQADARYANLLNSIAVLYQALGDYARAVQYQRRALVAWQEQVGRNHPSYANALANQGILFMTMGDYAQAEKPLREAIEIHRWTVGARTPMYASAVNHLGRTYQSLDDHERAELFLLHATEIARSSVGTQSSEYAAALASLAELYGSLERYEEALKLATQNLTIRRRGSPNDPEFANAVDLLGSLHGVNGDLDAAEPLIREALQRREETLGERHPHVADSLTSLAAYHVRSGHPERAEPLLRRSLDITRANLELAAAAQSERQQLAMANTLRWKLDRYLSLPAELTAPYAYRYMLAWKGSVFARQQQIRLVRAAGNDAAAKLLAELQDVSRRLAPLVLDSGSAEDLPHRRLQINRLTDRRERLEQDLAASSLVFQQDQAARQLAPHELQSLLPEDLAMVDFLVYTRYQTPADGRGPMAEQQRLLAFIVRRDGEIDRLELGNMEPITAAVDRWRETWGQGGGDNKESSGAVLRRRLWAPIEPLIDEAAAVLISPDGNVARVPFAALPGSDPSKYLLEERAVATLPVPQLLPVLFGGRAGDDESPSLLLVGDVDFGAASGESSQRGLSRSAAVGLRSRLRRFPPLEATRSEILAIGDTFEFRFEDGNARALRRDRATEAMFRRYAPRHRWLHVATHGFFSDDQAVSAVAGDRRDAAGPVEAVGYHPGLLSGLVLAGANLPPAAGNDDGILTAAEVACLDLGRVDGAVLSACETGLGRVAGGEGVLGLQRAFQLSGARSVVASLWRVPDDATQRLMERFYINLWDENKSRIEALRQAQLWMLRDGARRGLVRVEDLAPEERRAPPFYWAAFVLSGDWR